MSSVLRATSSRSQVCSRDDWSPPCGTVSISAWHRRACEPQLLALPRSSCLAADLITGGAFHSHDGRLWAGTLACPWLEPPRSPREESISAKGQGEELTPLHISSAQNLPEHPSHGYCVGTGAVGGPWWAQTRGHRAAGSLSKCQALGV